MNEQFDRTIGLIGEDNFHKIQDKRIAIIGLGGVGGTALEALVRTGFQHFVLIDFDNVDITNLNRQILYTSEDVGKLKVESAKNRILSVNPNCDIATYNLKIDAQNIHTLSKIDFIVDAIDDIKGKIAIAKFANENNIPVIVSLGMAKKKDPSCLKIVRLDKTTTDPLARKLRYEMKKVGIDTSKIMSVYSTEVVEQSGAKLNSLMMVPSTAGLLIASYVLDYLLKE